MGDYNNIKEFYENTYETDDLNDYIRPEATFDDLYNAVINGHDLYNVIGIDDSVIRERLFKELAYRVDSDYIVIYDLWIDNVK